TLFGSRCSCRSRRRTRRRCRRPWPTTIAPTPTLPAAPPSWARCCASSWATSPSKLRTWAAPVQHGCRLLMAARLRPGRRRVRPALEAGIPGVARTAFTVPGPGKKSVLTKSELMQIQSRRQPHLKAEDVDLAVKTLLEAMAATLAEGERIEIRGFGSFSLHYRPPRMGRNPKTGEPVALAGKHVPHFKPGQELRARVSDVMPVDEDD